MVYYRNWSEYELAAIDLYNQSPAKVRYCVKFRPSEGKLVLKITDNYKCLKYKTHSSIILNRFESLNLRLLTLMSARQSLPPPADDTLGAVGAVGAGGGEGSVVPPSIGVGGAAPAGTGTGGVRVEQVGGVAGGKGGVEKGGSGGGGGKKKKKSKK